MQLGKAPPVPTTEDDPRGQLRAEADRCVKCGMCLSECPTYRLSDDESESPRGRIALIEGLISGALQADRTLQTHLGNCLLCRRCERVCPSQVRYGALIDGARQLLPRRAGGALAAITQRPGPYRVAVSLARAVPPALSRPLGQLHLAHRLARALPDRRAAPAAGSYPPLAHAGRGRVGLFTGCATAVQQGGALQDALLLLRHAGYHVEIPEGAACCGALASHHGDPAGAARLAERNRRAFTAGLDAVLSIASGCGIQLDDYHPPLSAPHRDVCRFLLETGSLDGARFRPFAGRVMLHTPCSMENVYRGGHWARELLALIPQIELVGIGQPGQCCGSAGDYMLHHRETAVRLRQPLLDQALAGSPGILLSGNVGCAMHIAEGLGSGAGIEVLHPVQLLARQLVAGSAD
jgi:glycolate oxidase iron-sulfur subunit